MILGGRITPRAQQKTVLEGVFTAAQADRGAVVYRRDCAGCHDGADVDGPPLTGAPFVDRWREDTVASLFDFIKTEMPQRAPGSLSEAQYLDILAHLLHENDYPAGQQELTVGCRDQHVARGAERPAAVALWRAGRRRRLPGAESLAGVGPRAGGGAARVRVGDEITAAEATPPPRRHAARRPSRCRTSATAAPRCPVRGTRFSSRVR